MSSSALRHRRKYFATHRWANKTGAGVSETLGATNFDDELERRCFAFERMHELFKNCPHLDPAFELNTGRGVVKFSSRNKAFDIHRSTTSKDGDSYHNSTLEKVTELEGAHGEDQDNNVIESHTTQEDQEGNGQESQESNTHYQGRTFAAYRSPAPSTTTSSSNSKKRSRGPLTPSGVDSGTVTDNVRRNPPNGLFDAAPKGKVRPLTLARVEDIMTTRSTGNTIIICSLSF